MRNGSQGSTKAVASGRNRDGVSVTLDVTKRGDAEAAVRAAIDRFGRIDVLVNNAASFYAGYFEELTPEQMEHQLATSLIGPMNVTEQSTNYAAPSIEEYDERRAKQLEFWKAQNGRQSGDPAKLARALIVIASREPPPGRFIAGGDGIATAEHQIADLKSQIDAFHDLSNSLAFDEA